MNKFDTSFVKQFPFVRILFTTRFMYSLLLLTIFALRLPCPSPTYLGIFTQISEVVMVAALITMAAL